MWNRVKSIVDHIVQTRLDSGKSLELATQITNELKVDYSKFNDMFLSECGITIEKLYRMQVIDKMKELLVYTDQSLAQITIALGYTDTSLLSDLLKANTGLAPSHFKEIRKNKLEIIKRQGKMSE